MAQASRKQFVKGAALHRSATGSWRLCRARSAAEQFRELQLAAWREATGRGTPTVVSIAVNGVEYTDELAARRGLKEAA